MGIVQFFSIAAIFTFTTLLHTFLLPAAARDPDIVADFLIPPIFNASDIDGSFFTYTGMRVMPNLDPLLASVDVTSTQFPALDGQGVSASVIVFQPGSPTKPHIHPRASELMFLIDGRLDVGFVDSNGKLYEKSLQAGDAFLFPQGLVHYMFCTGNDVAVAISAFGSANPGTVSIPETLFGLGVDERVLARSFHVDVRFVQIIKARIAASAFIKSPTTSS